MMYGLCNQRNDAIFTEVCISLPTLKSPRHRDWEALYLQDGAGVS